MNEGEVYLNYIGYHLKQSAEMTLKYQLEAGKVERAIQGVQEYLEILHESELEMEKEDSELSMNDYEEGGDVAVTGGITLLFLDRPLPKN